jgi:hypothetical protein
VRAALGGGSLQHQLEALVTAIVRHAVEDPDGFHVYMSALYGVNRTFQVEAMKLVQEYLTLLGAALAKQSPYRKMEPASLEIHALWLFSASESFVLAARARGYSDQHLGALTLTIVHFLMKGLL